MEEMWFLYWKKTKFIRVENIMNIPLVIVILYVVLLLGISVVISKKSKESGEDFLLYKGKNNTLITTVTISGLAIG